MFLTLWNIYRFHSDYAALDGFDPETSPKGKNTPLDDWVLLDLQKLLLEQISNSKIGISTRHAEISKNSSLMMFPIGMLEGLDADFGKRPTAMTNCLPAHTAQGIGNRFKLIAPVSPFMSDTITEISR